MDSATQASRNSQARIIGQDKYLCFSNSLSYFLMKTSGVFSLNATQLMNAAHSYKSTYFHVHNFTVKGLMTINPRVPSSDSKMGTIHKPRSRNTSLLIIDNSTRVVSTSLAHTHDQVSKGALRKRWWERLRRGYSSRWIGMLENVVFHLLLNWNWTERDWIKKGHYMNVVKHHRRLLNPRNGKETMSG